MNVPFFNKVIWAKKKPKFNKECLLLTATWWTNGNHWHYSIWTVEKLHSDEGWYWGLLCDDGEEWGDINDLKADLYCLLPLIPAKKK